MSHSMEGKTMRIQHNIAALNSYRNLGTNNSGVAKNLEKLSSGYRINRAGDDAAGLAISEKMRSQITGLNTATKNANDGISLVQTAEGALTEVHSMLNRMVEIATQSANGVYEDGVDRQALQDEMNALTDEIDRIADGTNFNKKNLLDGSLSGAKAGVVGTAATKGDGGAGDAGTITYNFAGITGAELIKTGEVKIGNKTLKVIEGDAPANTKDSITIAKDTADTDIAGQVAEALQKNQDQDAVFDGIKIAGADPADVAKDDTGSAGVQAQNATVVFTSGTSDDKEVPKGGAVNWTIANVDVKTKNTALNLQIGDTNAEFNHLEVMIKDMHAKELGISTKDINVQTGAAAGLAIDKINNAINQVSTQRGKLGAIQNRLEHTINNLSVNAENMTAAESRIRDVDMADEMMKYTKNNILVQASQAMLAQANQVPQGVLQLLQ